MYHDPGQSGGLPRGRKRRRRKAKETQSQRNARFRGLLPDDTSDVKPLSPKPERPQRVREKPDRARPLASRPPRQMHEAAEPDLEVSTKRQRGTAVANYDQLSGDEKQAALREARKHPGRASNRAILHIHDSRHARNQEIARQKLIDLLSHSDAKPLAQHPPGSLQALGLTIPASSVPLLIGKAGKLIDQATGGSFAPGKLDDIALNAARELFDIPANAAPSTYHTFKPLLKGDVKQTAENVIEPYKQLAKDPVGTFEEGPLSTALLVAGPLKGGDMAVGRAVARATGRAPELSRRVVPDTALEEIRRPSKGLVAGAVQRSRDRKRGVHRMSEHEIRTRMDERVAASEDIRRQDVPQAVHEAVTALKGTKNPAVSLVAQNVVRNKAEARAYRDQVAAHIPHMQGEFKRAAEQTVKNLDKALKNWDQSKIEIAARRYSEVSRKQQEELGQLYGEPQRLEKARLMPYAIQHMGVKPEDMAKVSIPEIRAHMKANNVSEPAYLTHAPKMRGAKNFFVPTERPAKVGPSGRTGQAVVQGSLDISQQAMVEQTARAQGLITTAREFPKTVAEFAVRKDSGRGGILTGTYKQMRDAALSDRYGKINGESVPMRPVKLNPFTGGTKEQFERMVERANAYPDAEDAIYDDLRGAMEDGISSNPKDQSGQWALIPEAAADQLELHLSRARPTTLGRIGNIYGSQFRRTVLALSPKWLTGNIVEAAFRSLVAGVTPADAYRGYRALKEAKALNPEAERQAQMRIAGGGHYSLVRRNNVRTQAEHFAGTKLAGLASAMGKMRRTPGAKQVGDVWNAYTDFVFNTLNGHIETGFQTAMLGKALRDSHLMSGSVTKLSSKAFEQAAKGLTNTNEQVRLAREVDRMYGKYSKFSPGVKRAIATYTPFIAWTRNAIEFLGKVLPMDHPTLTALLAASSKESEEWRKDKKLAMMIDSAVPGFLQGSIPGKDGSHLRVSRYLPFGIAGGTENLADTVLPQYTSILQALQGKDWKGQPLPSEGTDTQEVGRGMAAAVALLEGSVPAASVTKNLVDSKGDLRKQFDPFRFTPASKSQREAETKSNNPFGGSEGNPYSSGGSNPYKSSGGNPYSSSGSNPYK